MDPETLAKGKQFLHDHSNEILGYGMLIGAFAIGYFAGKYRGAAYNIEVTFYPKNGDLPIKMPTVQAKR